MATARETISKAVRKLRRIGRGASLSSEAFTDHLDELNAMLAGWVGGMVGLPFQDLRIVSATIISPRYPSQRLLCQHGSALSLTLPRGSLTTPVPDGMLVSVVDVAGVAASYPITINRNGWMIEGAASNVTLNTNGASRVWIFRSDLGDWKRVTDLAADDPIPYPERFHHGIALCLAESLQGEYGAALAPPDVAMAGKTRRDMRALYGAPPNQTFDLGATLIGGAYTFGGLRDELDPSYDGEYGG